MKYCKEILPDIFITTLGTVYERSYDYFSFSNTYEPYYTKIDTFYDHNSLRLKVAINIEHWKVYNVDELVAAAFLPVSKKRFIKHIDNNPKNCQMYNLVWTKKESNITIIIPSKHNWLEEEDFNTEFILLDQ